MTMKVSEAFSNTGKSIKSIVKILSQTSRSEVKVINDDRSLVILANGPSLNYTINNDIDALKDKALLAVNFAANSEIFSMLRPEYYVLADPHFFQHAEDKDVNRLYANLRNANWQITLFVPVKYRKKALNLVTPSDNIIVKGYNPVGVEGWKWLKYCAFSSGRGMPRPRNVLIPALMIAINLGYKDIFITGADHSWTKTLDVTDENVVVSVQPHFYTETDHEKKRVATEYRGYRLHQILESFMVAFRSYFEIEVYARKKGVNIYNATPGSFIDAFRRKRL